MKHWTICLAIGFTACLLAAAFQSGESAVTAQEKKPAGQLRHVVLFKFKADATKEQVQEVEKAFAALPTKIEEIKGFEWGTDVSVEGKSEGLTHCFIVTFADAKGRDAYMKHTAHDEFVKLAGPRIEKVVVVDFVSQTK